MANVPAGQQVRQHIDGLRTNTVAADLHPQLPIYRWGWQLSTNQALDEACVRSSARSAPRGTTAGSPAGNA